MNQRISQDEASHLFSPQSKMLSDFEVVFFFLTLRIWRMNGTGTRLMARLNQQRRFGTCGRRHIRGTKALLLEPFFYQLDQLILAFIIFEFLLQCFIWPVHCDLFDKETPHLPNCLAILHAWDDPKIVLSKL
jgi:hypothetical protein